VLLASEAQEEEYEDSDAQPDRERQAEQPNDLLCCERGKRDTSSLRTTATGVSEHEGCPEACCYPEDAEPRAKEQREHDAKHSREGHTENYVGAGFGCE